MIATAVDRLRGIFRPPDPRTPEELENDLAEELAFHLDGLEREALPQVGDVVVGVLEALGVAGPTNMQDENEEDA